uniref:peptide-methionine (S)-S-oxide reductase n=1 Tax=Haptolina brevifila TaxID=156173 RepID=A0A7S2G2J6_9EUKA|mmetsp:Transcript_25433/g.51103  ORF Transcript_25433/g.51103 Transcript_25433/m.51103 type:complete len:311 (+) Transcript_25433:1-933(+)
MRFMFLASVASAAAFSLQPLRPCMVLPRATVAVRMADDGDGKSPLAALKSFPLASALLALVTVDCGIRLTSSVPALVGAAPPNYLGTALDAGFFLFGTKTLLEQAGIIGKSEYYSDLEGGEVNSFAREAGEFALRGEVPSLSNAGFEVATFAGGCFWGTELHFQRIPGVIATCVGYTQGNVEKPSYEQVCGGLTGHTEGIQLAFDPAVVRYDDLCDKLLAVLGTDVMEVNRVGNDRGTQYRHGIYPHTDAQAEAAGAAIARCQATKSAKVVTEVKPATVFWPAEGYHQRYLQKGGQSAEKECIVPVRCYG